MGLLDHHVTKEEAIFIGELVTFIGQAAYAIAIIAAAVVLLWQPLAYFLAR